MKYERGSEWRKWDLHIHTPETKLNNGYYGNDWDKYIEKIEASDISVFGITDYFSIENYKKFLKEFNTKYPNSQKVFFPNIEFRLDSKNSRSEHIQIHVLFSNDIATSKIDKFLTRLPLVSTKKYCTDEDLLSVTYQKAMITVDNLKEKLTEDFSDNDYIIIGVANGYGALRPNNTSDGRGAEYAKELDKKCGMFFGKEKDVDFYLNKKPGREELNLPPKAVLVGSDCHSFDDMEEKLGVFFTWIKADPTFEGMRQILCEPKDRVRIQENKPDEKSGYQVIDSISIDSDHIKQRIQFNPNLNTIIGGRSTGKSTLLKILASKLNHKDIKKEEFVNNLAENTDIRWKDGEENKERDVEFFPQNYMHDIARVSIKKDELIQDIIKGTEAQKKIDDYDDFCNQNKDNIQANIDILFGLQKDINTTNLSLKEKGDKKGLEVEIKTINESIAEIKTSDNFSDKDAVQFEEINTDILKAEQYIKTLDNDKAQILLLKNEPLFASSIIYKFNELSNHSKPKINKIFEEISERAIKTWKEELDKELTAIDTEINTHKQLINTKKEHDSFIKGKKHIAGNRQYSELSERLKIEQQKLHDITGIENRINLLGTQKTELFDTVVSKHCEYLSQIKSLESSFLLEHEDIKIQVKIDFQEKKCKELLKDFVNLQAHKRQQYVDNFPANYQEKQKETIQGFLEKALKNQIELKAYKDIKDLVKGLLVQNWFLISYELTYQNDIFEVMSDGKKAFVILKLLLDFSQKKCPILIDQPEDSLDNRAIYNELVSYIKQKKIERQIILVTHNANIVVNADAEEVIVANQHGKDSKNEDNIKFQYISGSLENTKTKNDTKVVLNSQGVKEHACEILEGGKEAFENREKKYGF